MDFRCNDPGAVQYGNFINYYQFNSAEERLQLLPTKSDIWKTWNNAENSAEKRAKYTYIVLDIGCNSGLVTQLIYKFLKNEVKSTVKVLAVDIDPVLIQRATEKNENPDDVIYECLNIMNRDSSEVIKQFLNTYEKERFDLTLCFSITMWIHLNHEDKGLKRFLENCVDRTKLLVIEPQPWKCYQTAIRRMKKAKDNFPNFNKLNWRLNVERKIQDYLEFDLNQEKIYESQPTNWKRKICIYRHK